MMALCCNGIIAGRCGLSTLEHMMEQQAADGVSV